LMDRKPVRDKPNTWIATYAFRDGSGALIKFSQYLKAKDDSGWLDAQRTVLFDPNNSASAAAYPLKLVVLDGT